MKKKGFVCQSCSNLVPPNTDRCPYCGKFFKGVRCPECLYVGNASDFVRGCPSCGYLSDQKKNSSRISETGIVEKKKPLPGWFYLVSAVFLTLCVVIFLLIIINM